jgi:hypothetical protein
MVVVLVLAAIVGGAAFAVTFWPVGWLAALVAASLGGSFVTAVIAVLIMGLRGTVRDTGVETTRSVSLADIGAASES